MSNCSDDDFDEYIYQIVEFVKRGRPSIRTIDIVPMKWINFNKKHCYIEANYKPPPYTEEDFDEIQKMVENIVDAPEEWPVYRVKIVARGKTYIDALKKLKLLSDKRFAFTSESDIKPGQKSALIEENFKSKVLQKNFDV